MKALLGLLLLLLSAGVNADMQIETIQLLYRTPDELIPTLQPMITEGGSLTGYGGKLIIKSTADNISQIRALLEELDKKDNPLKVSVSYIDQSHPSNQGASVRINGTKQHKHTQNAENSASDNGKIKYDAHVFSNRTAHADSATSVIAIADGHWGSISMGQAIPFASRQRNTDGTVTETIEYKNVMSGYRIKPVVNGDNVTITIQQQQQSRQADQSIISSAIETVVNGKLGEWLHLGGVDHAKELEQSGLNYGTRIRSVDVNQIWVKVERQ